jgi:hypothetical protein
MIKHIVLWRLKEAAQGRTKMQNAALIKERLEELRGVVAGFRHIEVGLDFSASEQSSDLALYCEFDTREALAAYQAHPAHQQVMPLILDARSERRVVDYEV